MVVPLSLSALLTCSDVISQCCVATSTIVAAVAPVSPTWHPSFWKDNAPVDAVAVICDEERGHAKARQPETWDLRS